MVDGDFPRIGARWVAQGADGARASVEQRAGYGRVAKQTDGLLDRVSFANGSEIQHHAFAIEADGVIARVEVNMMHADAGAGLLDLVCGRQFARAPHESPAPDQWRDGDVESPAGFQAELPGMLQQRKEAGCDSHRFAGSALVQMRDLTRRPIQTEL